MYVYECGLCGHAVQLLIKTKTMNWMKNKDKYDNSTYISAGWEQKRTCWVYMLIVEVSTQRSPL